ncbi:hypothetical protein QJS04_geneDACA003556 [Acorus gramineus]|uniref:Transmembrane protein 199 n=1 Tax=Acorus gramineus TaxID=55184 RepID=A0AAV9BQQ9_ACOGR|nr:hypothetical protein QJS04_geneDACA003556 [Acorus gramineus]
MELVLSVSPSSSLGICSIRTSRRSEALTTTALFVGLPSRVTCQSLYPVDESLSLRKASYGLKLRNAALRIPRSTGSSSSSGSPDDSKTTPDREKAFVNHFIVIIMDLLDSDFCGKSSFTIGANVPFGYSRKDVLLIGLGVTVIGVGLKSGLEFFGVDPLQAGNVVQLVLVLGLTVGWISTYIFRVSNKEMTYAQQLRQYEKQVMEKRLEGLTEAELEALLEQVEEEKRRMGSGEKVQ